MKLIIERARKSDFPPGITGSHIFDDKYRHLWAEYDTKVVEDDPEVSAYYDAMEALVDSYSENEPSYYWNWYRKEEEI